MLTAVFVEPLGESPQSEASVQSFTVFVAKQRVH
jgi:hypothetical protein